MSVANETSWLNLLLLPAGLPWAVQALLVADQVGDRVAILGMGLNGDGGVFNVALPTQHQARSRPTRGRHSKTNCAASNND
jgi:hypothetical protein